MITEGRWAEPQGVPPGEITWHPPCKAGLKTYVATIEGRVVATVKGNPYRPGWVTRIPGWLWAAPTKGSTAERLGIQETPVKAFLDVASAKEAVQNALVCLPKETA